MAAVGKILVTVTPEIQEVIDYVTPVAKASADFFDCICEHGGDMRAPECNQQATDWSTLTVNYKAYKTFHASEQRDDPAGGEKDV